MPCLLPLRYCHFSYANSSDTATIVHKPGFCQFAYRVKFRNKIVAAQWNVNIQEFSKNQAKIHSDNPTGNLDAIRDLIQVGDISTNGHSLCVILNCLDMEECKKLVEMLEKYIGAENINQEIISQIMNYLIFHNISYQQGEQKYF